MLFCWPLVGTLQALGAAGDMAAVHDFLRRHGMEALVTATTVRSLPFKPFRWDEEKFWT